MATLARELHFYVFRFKTEDIFKTDLTVKTRSFNANLRILVLTRCWPISAKVSYCSRVVNTKYVLIDKTRGSADEAGAPWDLGNTTFP